MNITLLGTGMQGRAALFDLARSERVRSITAADRDVDGLRAFVREKKLPKAGFARNPNSKSEYRNPKQSE